ncbi:MAG: endonuclease [Ruegeria sp.]
MDRTYINQQAEARVKARKEACRRHEVQLQAMQSGKSFKWDAVEEVSRLVTRARSLGMTSDADELMRDPSNVNVGNRIFEKIIDANNLLDISYLSEGTLVSRAVGRIVLPVPGGNRLGSGFMVSPRVLMTNNHVLESEVQASNARVEFDFYAREGGATGPVKEFQFRPDLLFITDIGLDFTLLAVEEVNGAGDEVRDRGWIPLLGPSGKAVVGERVSVIQHPNGEPQKVVVHDNKVTDVDGSFLLYRTDTMGGSSGSPVFNINWDLAALHHAAVGSANEGIRISSIVSYLRNETTQEGLTADLLAEALSAERSIQPAWPAPTPHPAIQGADGMDGPVMNPDGTASWTIPVSITLGIGDRKPVAVAPQLTSPAAVLADTAPTDEDLQIAMKALEATEGRVYYSKVKDEQDRKEYYSDLDAMTDAQLYTELSNLISRTHTTTLSYKKARLAHLYPWIDRREGPNRELRGVYSNKVFDTLEVIRNEIAMERQREAVTRKQFENFGPVDQEFLEELEASHPFNCEHVVPQSWFNKRKQPKTDLHHLFTCEWGCNSFRSNHAYFDFSQEAFRDNCGESADGKFEPKNGKGAAARATLYFLLRYPGDIADSIKEMPLDRLPMLIDWANSDKVDRWELHRNAEIFKVQGNRNPLIDFPDLVDRIDFSLGWKQ